MIQEPNSLYAHSLVYSGRYVNLLAPLPCDVHTIDIAHHLATINRWCGAAVRPISVAEHSLLVLGILRKTLDVQCPATLLAGLLHDAHEAYLQDDTTPKRQAVQSMSLSADAAHADLRARWDRAIYQRYKVTTAAQTGHALIKRADLIALATERAQLLPDQRTPWPALDGIQPAQWADLRGMDATTWWDWRDLYRSSVEALQMDILERSAAIGRGEG